MQKLNPQDPTARAQVESIIAKIKSQWAQDRNVLDILPAIKTVGPYAQPDTLAIGFYVREKVDLAKLTDRGYLPIPDQIEDVPTDVIQAITKPRGTVDTKSTRSQMFDTLAGGIAVGNANMNVYGTLGMILFAQSDSRPLGLTNEHVLVNDIDGHVGDEVQQPRFYLLIRHVKD